MMTIIHSAADLAIAAYLGGLSGYDIENHRVTNKSLLVFLPLVLLTCTVKVLSENFAVLIPLLLGSAVGFTILLTAAMITNGGIGGGDIKLAAVLGLATGLHGMLILLAVSSVGAVLYGLAFRKRNRRIAFVPFMTLGYIAAVLI